MTPLSKRDLLRLLGRVMAPPTPLPSPPPPLQASSVAGVACAPMTVLATLCVEMPSMAGCDNYNSLCGAGSKVEYCSQATSIPGWVRGGGGLVCVCVWGGRCALCLRREESGVCVCMCMCV